MDLPEELTFDRPDYKERYHRAVPGYMRRIRELYEAIHARFGEEGLELIRDVSRGYGTRVGENVRRHRGEQRGLTAVGRFLLEVFDMVSDDWDIAEYTDEKLIITVSRCPYPFTDDCLCRAHTCMEKALVGALDPDLDYTIGRSIPAGDACCEHILSVRPTDQEK